MKLPVLLPVSQYHQTTVLDYHYLLYSSNLSKEQSCLATISDDPELSFVNLQGQIISVENDIKHTYKEAQSNMSIIFEAFDEQKWQTFGISMCTYCVNILSKG